MKVQELTLQEMKEVNGGLLGLFGGGGGGCKNDCHDDRCYDPCKDRCYDPCHDSGFGINVKIKIGIGIWL